MIKLDAQSAEHMGVLILEGSQGTTMMIRQRPLTTIDLGDAWLVRGQPYDDSDLELQSCMFHVVFDKYKANILSIGLDGRFSSLPGETGLEKQITQDIKNTRVYFDLAYAIQGGLINSSSAAVEYARQIMRCRGQNTRGDTRHRSSEPSLSAEERNQIWQIKEVGTTDNIFAFSRLTCQIFE